MKKIDLVGHKYGRLTVIEPVGNIGRWPAWKCICDCGNECIVKTPCLRSGNTKSCGCLRKEIAANKFRENASSKRKDILVSTYGYCLVHAKENQNVHVNGKMFEHRKIMEDYIGRPLTKDEVVHHKNGNKKDNRIENLELMTRREHSSLHMRERNQKKGVLTYQ